MSLSHWDWRVSGCCLEGLESRNCLAGLRDVCVLRWMFPLDFWRKSRTKRSFWRLDAQPSAEIVRVECAKCRRECDLSHVRATLCGDRACRVREMQATARFVPCARNPLRRSCVSSAQNAGESAICPAPAPPSAQIVRVECAKCRRECDLSGARATLCGGRARRAREMQASTGDFVVQL